MTGRGMRGYSSTTMTHLPTTEPAMSHHHCLYVSPVSTLSCVCELYSPDKFGFCDLRVVFIDTVRGVAGAMCVVVTNESPQHWENIIRLRYDQGKYETLSVAEALEIQATME